MKKSIMMVPDQDVNRINGDARRETLVNDSE